MVDRRARRPRDHFYDGPPVPRRLGATVAQYTVGLVRVVGCVNPFHSHLLLKIRNLIRIAFLAPWCKAKSFTHATLPVSTAMQTIQGHVSQFTTRTVPIR